jgi:hypothetical protein
MKTEKIFTLTAHALKKALAVELLEYGYVKGEIHNKNKFLYAEGNAPYMLVAHLDTVHKQVPSIICYSQDGNYIMSPQGIGGDDRCGVYIILSLLKKLPFKPYIVFTMEEETGGHGASAFVGYLDNKQNHPELKYIVEFDRKGNKDCVFYHCNNADFVKFVEGFGFKKAYGTFSDISIIAPSLGVAAVNLSSGYYNPHTEHEYVSMNDMHDIIDAAQKMLCAESKTFEYIEDECYNHSNYKKQKVSVSFIPECMVYVCSYYTNSLYVNRHKEIAIDQLGNYYKYSSTYDDLMPLYADVVPIDDGYEPTYDAANARLVTKWY